jgi:hypothetical protein
LFDPREELKAMNDIKVTTQKEDIHSRFVEQSRIHTSREREEAHGNGEQQHRLNKIEEQRR